VSVAARLDPGVANFRSPSGITHIEKEVSMFPSETGHPAAELEYQVFTVTRPGLNPDVPAGYESLMWVSNSATLIYGERDAVLVDTFLTLDQSLQLADQVEASGKNLTYIYITHGHGDHYFGISTLKDRFPNARAVALASVVDRIHQRLAGDIQLFSRVGQLPDDTCVPESLDGGLFELEGHALTPIEIGYTDVADSTSLHVPSIGLVAAGDVVYNGIHPYLSETTGQSRVEWSEALATLDALEPQAVVAGHKVPDHDDDPRNIAETRQYLRDFILLDETTDTARELFDAMIELYPDRANPGSLLGGANAAKREAEKGSPSADG
jgi:glyoxylase-like metal-dependent hydrolase (beta-lactamase superfamily II)